MYKKDFLIKEILFIYLISFYICSIIQLFCVSLQIMKQTYLRNYIIFLFILVSATLLASNKSGGLISYPGGKCYMFRVTLKDKEWNHLIPWIKPEKFLSKASLLRRERQGLKLDSTDLPVSPDYIQQIKKRGGKVVAGE